MRIKQIGKDCLSQEEYKEFMKVYRKGKTFSFLRKTILIVSLILFTPLFLLIIFGEVAKTSVEVIFDNLKPFERKLNYYYKRHKELKKKCIENLKEKGLW